MCSVLNTCVRKVHQKKLISHKINIRLERSIFVLNHLPNQRHHIALFLTIVIVCPLFTMVYFPIKEKYLEILAFEKMEKAALQTITIAKKDLVWVKSGKEIIFKNDLYDVEKIKASGDSLILSVLKDKDEMQLLALKNKINTSSKEHSLVIQKQASQLSWTNNFMPMDADIFISVVLKPKLLNYTSSLEKGALKSCFSPPWLS